MGFGYQDLGSLDGDVGHRACPHPCQPHKPWNTEVIGTRALQWSGVARGYGYATISLRHTEFTSRETTGGHYFPNSTHPITGPQHASGNSLRPRARRVNMVLEDPTAQLHSELYTTIRSALKPRRPIIHHLNDDSSWLLQIPRPEVAIRKGCRIYFNVLIDPWLTGGQSDVSSWFSRQFHATPSAVESIKELEDLIRGVERDASVRTSRVVLDAVAEQESGETMIDIVAVSHEFTDHAHRETLLEVHKDVPVFAFPKAAALIRGWNHFRTVVAIDSVGAGQFDWRSSTSNPFLPEWLGISRIRQTYDPWDLHSALLITFNNRQGRSKSELASKPNRRENLGRRNRHFKDIGFHEDDDAAEALIYTPHGVHFAEFEVIARAVPPIDTLVFLHGLHSIRVGAATGSVALQLNLGSHNGLKAQRLLRARYWLGTHDEASLDYIR